MADPARYRYLDTAARPRSPPLYNPARASMPVTGGGYSSLYSGDGHVMSASHHEGLVSRPADEYRTSAVPVSATTYAVRKEPVSRSASVKDGTRVHRVIEQTSKRPIIVTTKHQPPSGPRSGSPSRDPYRSSDEGQYYAQPASSIPRGRAAGHVPFSAAMDDEEYRRLKDRTQYDRLHGTRGGDSYRHSRPGPLYAGPHHRSNTINFDDEGYEYTKPSDLARYDLDHGRPRRTRRESLDRYYRPTVSIPTDLTRPYEQTERRLHGPPPSSWGLDKLNRAAAGGIYDGAGLDMPLPPAVPRAPDARRSGLLETPGSPTAEHRHPVSLLQEDPSRSGHHDDYYLDDDLPPREYHVRDRDYFQDDVTSRGFGIRIDSNDREEYHRPEKIYREEDHHRPSEKIYREEDHHRPYEKYYPDERRDRREARRGYVVDREPRRRSDDDLEIVRHEYEHRDHKKHRDRDEGVDEDGARERKDAKPASDDELDRRKDKIQDKAAAGLALAAAYNNLKSALKVKDDKDNEDSSPSRRYRDEEVDHRKLDGVDPRSKGARREPMLDDEDYEIVEHPRDHERPRNETAAEPGASAQKKDDAPASLSRDHSSSTDEGKARTRRRPRASSFNPNDTAGLAALKAELAATEGKEKPTGKDTSPAKEPSPERRSSPPEKRDADADFSALILKEDKKGSDPAPPARDERQVRVVTPPKEGQEKKPIKGILKQPRAQFPEEPNPVREGVAPHKDDKSKANVPPGARWTKISRKMVNPEALKIGKERFEVRDDFVIVLRVLSKEEIQAYAAATATLRERRRKELEREMRDAEVDHGRDDDDDKRRRHRQHRRDRDDHDDRRERDRERDKERERDRHRRHGHGSEDDSEDDGYEVRSRPAEYHGHGHGYGHGHHRSHRD
ncbi:hypothetical protein VTK56DRAFT_3506 [Thermocarpiscus australiensis]